MKIPDSEEEFLKYLKEAKGTVFHIEQTEKGVKATIVGSPIHLMFIIEQACKEMPEIKELILKMAAYLIFEEKRKQNEKEVN
jgi:hypothetical protein